MSKKIRKARIELKKKRKQKRLFPFNTMTELRQLVKNTRYRDLSDMLKSLEPYLLNGVRGLYGLTRLDFDLVKVKGCLTIIYIELAEFLKKAQETNGLKYPKSVFIRYLCSPDHCNMNFTESTLKRQLTKVFEAIR